MIKVLVWYASPTLQCLHSNSPSGCLELLADAAVQQQQQKEQLNLGQQLDVPFQSSGLDPPAPAPYPMYSRVSMKVMAAVARSSEETWLKTQGCLLAAARLLQHSIPARDALPAHDLDKDFNPLTCMLSLFKAVQHPMPGLEPIPNPTQPRSSSQGKLQSGQTAVACKSCAISFQIMTCVRMTLQEHPELCSLDVAAGEKCVTRPGYGNPQPYIYLHLSSMYMHQIYN